jgi:hypothetical protein
MRWVCTAALTDITEEKSREDDNADPDIIINNTNNTNNNNNNSNTKKTKATTHHRDTSQPPPLYVHYFYTDAGAECCTAVRETLEGGLGLLTSEPLCRHRLFEYSDNVAEGWPDRLSECIRDLVTRHDDPPDPDSLHVFVHVPSFLQGGAASHGMVGYIMACIASARRASLIGSSMQLFSDANGNLVTYLKYLHSTIEEKEILSSMVEQQQGPETSKADLNILDPFAKLSASCCSSSDDDDDDKVHDNNVHNQNCNSGPSSYLTIVEARNDYSQHQQLMKSQDEEKNGWVTTCNFTLCVKYSRLCQVVRPIISTAANENNNNIDFVGKVFVSLSSS